MAQPLREAPELVLHLGGVKVNWTAPNVTSTIHNACSHDVYWNGTQIRTRAAPSGCIPH